MPYTALPDRRMPYDNDGTILVFTNQHYAYTAGPARYPSGAQVLAFNGQDPYTATTLPGVDYIDSNFACGFWWFFPEQREVTAAYFNSYWLPGKTIGQSTSVAPFMRGSNDSTNGLDGTWETASWPGGSPYEYRLQLDDWRSKIRPISFTGGKRVVSCGWTSQYFDGFGVRLLHLYGEKQAGQTPDDLIFINHDDTPGVEFTAPEDFGDQPLGTTVVRQFRVKNTSATKTANTINIQCNDSDFAISTDNVNWVVTINIASLSAGAESSTMYVRCTTPAPGAVLGPRFARIVALVASYT